MVEIGKTEKVDMNSVRIVSSGRRTALTTKIMSLDPGQGFLVEGMERDRLANVGASLRKEGRIIHTERRGVLKFFVWREK